MKKYEETILHNTHLSDVLQLLGDASARMYDVGTKKRKKPIHRLCPGGVSVIRRD